MSEHPRSRQPEPTLAMDDSSDCVSTSVHWAAGHDDRGSAPLLEPGAMLDHYQVIRLLGRGAMGEVHLARDTKLGRKVALKIIAPALLGSEEAVQRLMIEARTTAKFSHPSIVTIHGVGEYQGHPYLALEYLEGEDLGSRLAERALSLQETLRLMLVVAEALEEAHSHGVLHRDLKPENIVIPRDGRPRVVDFGLAKELSRLDSIPPSTRQLAESDRPPPSRGAKGTPSYMSPEQWLGRDHSPAIDIWAFGVMLFELAADEPPFGGDTVAAKAEAVCRPEPAPRVDALVDVPVELADLVAACLDKAPERRPNAAAVATTLRQLLEVQARQVSEDESPFRGLFPFTQRHAPLFFGRDAEIAELVEHLRLRPLVAIVGSTGVGKSSFVQAGVVPRLREQERWVVITVRPGSQPFRALAARVTRHDQDSHYRFDSLRPSGSRPDGEPPEVSHDEQQRLAAELAAAPHRLSLELRRIGDEERSKVLLVVDQLEELFTMVEDVDEQRRFMAAVCSAADDALDPVRVVFTLRDDFLGRVAVSAEAREALTRVAVLKRLGPKELEQVLVRPVAALGYRFEDEALPREMVAEVVGEHAGLPLLQFAARLLWEGRDDERRVLLRATYEQMGGVGGALVRHADGLLDGFSQVELRLVRTLLTRLVTPERTRRSLPRSKALAVFDEAEGGDRPDRAVAEQLLTRLTKARLLSIRRVRGAGRSEALFELAHESLIRNWTTLARWLDEGKEELSFLAEVDQAAELWSKRGRRPEELWQGKALSEAARALERFDAPLSEMVREFLDGSFARERRRERRRRWLRAGVVAVALVAAGVAVLVAVVIANKEREARRHLLRAEEQHATALLEGARAATTRGDVLQARAMLRVALETNDSAGARALWWQLRSEPLVWRRQLHHQLDDVDYASDGRTIATSGHGASVYLIDPKTSRIRALRGHRDEVVGLAISPDNTRMATGSMDRRVVLWDLPSGKPVHELLGHEAGVLDVQFSPDGRLVASSGIDRTVRLWSVVDGKHQRTFSGPAPMPAAHISPDQQWLAAASMTGRVEIWSLETGARRWLLTDHRGPVYRVLFSPDGKLLASAGADKVVRLWDLASGEVARTLPGHRDTVSGLVFSHDGQRIATSSWDGTTHVWQVADGQLDEVLPAHGGAVPNMAFSADDRELVTCNGIGEVRLWALGVSRRRQAIPGHVGSVSALDYSADGTRIASGAEDGLVLLRDARTGATVARLTGHTDAIFDLAFDRSGKRLATGGRDQTVRLWDVDTGAQPRTLAGHSAQIYAVAFQPGGKLLASAGGDRAVRLWDVDTGALVRTLPTPGGLLTGLDFRPDGAELATAGRSEAIVLWDVAAGTVQRRLRGEFGAAGHVAYSPDGRLVAASASDNQIRLWSLDGPDDQPTRLTQTSPVNTVAFSPDGRTLAAGGSDGGLHLWDLATRTVRRATGHRGIVNEVSFHPDGRSVATSGEDGVVRLWEVATARPAWRGVGLVGAPPRLLTHNGWVSLDSAAADASQPPPAWSSELVAVAQGEAEAMADAPGGGHVCLQTWSGGLQLWRRGEARPAVAEPTAAVRQHLAHSAGCLVLGASGARLVTPAGDTIALGGSGDPQAIGTSGDELLLATDQEVVAFDGRGQRRASWAVGEGVTALVRPASDPERGLIVGYVNGDVERLPDGPNGVRLAFEQVQASPVTRMLEGPSGTVFIGHASGDVGMWHRSSGKRLATARVDGAVVHLRLVDDRLYVATDLGQHLTWDLRDLTRDDCELLRQVWTEVPVAWRNGRVVLEEPDRNHRCWRPDTP